MLDSFAILRRHHFVAALGVGGYAAGPMMLAAMLRRLPTVVFEPNAEPGFTNRVLARRPRASPPRYERPTKLWGKKATRREFPSVPNFSPFPRACRSSRFIF